MPSLPRSPEASHSAQQSDCETQHAEHLQHVSRLALTIGASHLLLKAEGRELTSSKSLISICLPKDDGLRCKLLVEIVPLVLRLAVDLVVLGEAVAHDDIGGDEVAVHVHGLGVADRERPVCDGTAEWLPDAEGVSMSARSRDVGYLERARERCTHLTTCTLR
jgi:hypothetical protein